jgi:Zn-dependent M28 family amino/carboxypeptidase
LKKQYLIIFLAIFSFAALVVALVLLLQPFSTQDQTFDPERAYQDVQIQINMGPRTPGSEAHDKVIEYITSELEHAGWKVEIQTAEKMGHPIQNIVARRGSGSDWIILGAHYDSRLLADQDEDASLASKPVPGANDGASGVAVLLELARVLPKEKDKQVWLVFFDAEDQGNLPGWDWILGSQAFVEQLSGKPDAVVVIDMIGDTDLNVYREKESNKTLTDEIWQTAADLGYSNVLIDEEKYSILDDHLPFLNAGIPAVDIIDMDYPFWHTGEDTADKVSPKSLEIIGMTLLTWLER